MKNTIRQENLNFNGLGIAPRLLEILGALGYDAPTPIQCQTIPASLEGKDLVGIAQTGTGKTLAFGIPMLQRLAINKGRGLVVLPTRDLALQVDESLRTIGQKIGLRTAVLIGGEPMPKQLNALRRQPHIIIATPGRLIDHTGRGTVRLGDVKILVLDEADMMLDMGFLPQIKEIIKLVPRQRQTMLFSATIPNEVMKIAADYMSVPIRIEVTPSGTAAEKVEHEVIVIDREAKFGQLKKLLSDTKGSVLVFARTKHGVKNLTRKIVMAGVKATEIHSNRSLSQRRKALADFKIGACRVLVATDIAARGIDIQGIELVVNYDIPKNSEDYVHRIGRTGRAGLSGKAVSFALPNELREVRDIERLIHKTLNITKLAKPATAGRAPFEAKVERQRPAPGQGRLARRPYSSVFKPGALSRHAPARPEGSGASQTNRRGKTARPFRNKKRQSESPFGAGSRSRTDNRPKRSLSDKERFKRSMQTGSRYR